MVGTPTRRTGRAAPAAHARGLDPAQSQSLARGLGRARLGVRPERSSGHGFGAVLLHPPHLVWSGPDGRTYRGPCSALLGTVGARGFVGKCAGRHGALLAAQLRPLARATGEDGTI